MTLRPSPSSPLRATWALLLVAPGCLLAELRLGEPFDAQDLAAVAVGTTREQALLALGPPDELYAERVYDRLRAFPPPSGEPAGDPRDARPDQVLTWTREVRRGRVVWLVPFVPFFTRTDEMLAADRIVALLDAQGRVTAVAHETAR